MALETGGGNLIYVSNYMGKFEVRVKPGTPNSIEREKKGGDRISVLNYTALRGHIVDIKKDVSEKNGIKMVSLKIFIDDVQDDKPVHYCLTLPYQSNLVTAFYHMMENINFDEPVRFSSKHGADDKGKEKTSLFISQPGPTGNWDDPKDWPILKWRYTKKWAEENPTAPKKPEWVQIQYKGELVWDNTAETKFFEAIVKDKIIPPLRRAKTAPAPAPAQEPIVDDSDIPSYEAVEEKKEVVIDDDLPF